MALGLASTAFIFAPPPVLLCCVWPLVFHWGLCMAVTAYNHLAVAIWFLLVRPLCVAFCWVKPRSHDFCSEGLKVCVNYVGDWELFVVVLEGELIFAPFNSYSRLADSLALRLVRLQQVFPRVAVEASLSKLFLMLMP